MKKISVVAGQKAVLAQERILRIYQWEQCCQQPALRKCTKPLGISVSESTSYQSWKVVTTQHLNIFNLHCMPVLHRQRTKLASAIKIATEADSGFSLSQMICFFLYIFFFFPFGKIEQHLRWCLITQTKQREIDLHQPILWRPLTALTLSLIGIWILSPITRGCNLSSRMKNGCFL